MSAKACTRVREVREGSAGREVGRAALVEVAAEQRGQVVGVVQRRPHAEGREHARRGRGGPARAQRYLARQLGRERAQPVRRQLAQRRVRVLHQRLVRVRLPRAAAAAACNATTVSHSRSHYLVLPELYSFQNI